uniref:Uncharacterized protein n=1 Tax=Yersinia enterocolitica TaxID=630 RepID=B0RKY7_YEREN|nr:hypothetical protein [Yersinia enterocolitica]
MAFCALVGANCIASKPKPIDFTSDITVRISSVEACNNSVSATCHAVRNIHMPSNRVNALPIKGVTTRSISIGVMERIIAITPAIMVVSHSGLVEASDNAELTIERLANIVPATSGFCCTKASLIA